MIQQFSNISIGSFFVDLLRAENRGISGPVEDYVVGVLVANLRMDEVFVKEEQQNLFRPMGIEYLRSFKSRPRLEDIREIGDTCLVLTGVFREFIRKRGVSTSYYIDIGKGSYRYAGHLAQKPINKVFTELERNFEDIAAILYNVSQKIMPSGILEN